MQNDVLSDVRTIVHESYSQHVHTYHYKHIHSFIFCLSLPSPPPQYHMVAKAAIDQLLVFVNYSEPGEANGGSSLLGVDSPSRMDSPDSFSNALLFKDAVEIVAEDEGGRGYVHSELFVSRELDVV